MHRALNPLERILRTYRLDRGVCTCAWASERANLNSVKPSAGREFNPLCPKKAPQCTPHCISIAESYTPVGPADETIPAPVIMKDETSLHLLLLHILVLCTIKTLFFMVLVFSTRIIN